MNCEVELDLLWKEDCVLIEHHNNKAEVNVMITSTKRYVPVVTFSIDDNIKFLEKLIQGFKRAISWNKYRSKITKQSKNNNLSYMIDQTFRNSNKLFVQSFKAGKNDPKRN